MKRANLRLIGFLLAAAPLVLLSGCAMFGLSNSRRHASSVVHYLYPDGGKHVDTPTIPVLSLPLKVGVAFVPEATARNRSGPFIAPENASFTEKQKMTLMKEVSDNFKKYPFVKSIELIPSAYLMPGGSFENLDQLRSMFGVDVIALLSYDQAQFTDEGLLSFAYWTVVGVYFIQGERNDTKTMMDAVVYDIASRKLLFRAPGTSQIKASATPVNLSEELRRDSERGFGGAATNMVANLQEQLALFQERAKDSPEEIKIVRKPGYVGGGSLGWFEVAFVLAVAGLFVWTRRGIMT